VRGPRPPGHHGSQWPGHVGARQRTGLLRPSIRPALPGYRDAVDTAARPVDQLCLGEFVEHQALQPVPDSRGLPGPQPSPDGVSGAVAELGGRSRQRQPVCSTNKMPSSAARSSTRGRPPGPRGAGRGVSRGSISSQSRSSTTRCCVVLATTGHDRGSSPQDRVVKTRFEIRSWAADVSTAPVGLRRPDQS
jgi:hypothetical protein